MILANRAIDDTANRVGRSLRQRARTSGRAALRCEDRHMSFIEVVPHGVTAYITAAENFIPRARRRCGAHRDHHTTHMQRVNLGFVRSIWSPLSPRSPMHLCARTTARHVLCNCSSSESTCVIRHGPGGGGRRHIIYKNTTRSGMQAVPAERRPSAMNASRRCTFT